MLQRERTEKEPADHRPGGNEHQEAAIQRRPPGQQRNVQQRVKCPAFGDREHRPDPERGQQRQQGGGGRPAGQRAGVFRSDLPKPWLVTTALSLMHAAAEDAAAGRIAADDAARLITTTLLAAFATPVAGRS